jgi:choice-of-anchor C domain-containing protein
MRDGCILCLLLVTMLSVLAPLGQCQLDINGGFENAAIDPGTWKELLPESTQINGWVVGGNGIDYIGVLWQPSEGSRSIDLSAYGAGTINTTLNTIPGTTYRLLFDMAGNPSGEPAEKSLDVYIDGDKRETFYFNTDGKTAENMGWQTNSLEFTATTSATRLAFVSLTNTASGPALDNVRIAVAGKTNDNGPDPNVDLTGVWSCDDGGIYYI